MNASSPPLRVLITGGAGFVGRHLVAALAKALPAGSDIVVGDHGTVPGLELPCRAMALDVTDESGLKAVLLEVRPTHVVHLAAIAAVPEATHDLKRNWTVNFGGTLNLALAVNELLPECRVLYCGSAEVYGASFRGAMPLDETAPIDPVNPYGAAKAAGDVAIGQMAHQGLRAIRLRPFNHIGPGQNEHFFVASIAAQLARIERGEQEPVIKVGDLTSRRDFLDVLDVVDAYTRALLRFDQIPNGSAINIASGNARAIREVLDDLLELCDVKVEIVSEPKRRRQTDIPVVVGDARRAKALLGWMPSREWKETLRSILEYWRKTPASRA